MFLIEVLGRIAGWLDFEAGRCPEAGLAGFALIV